MPRAGSLRIRAGWVPDETIKQLEMFVTAPAPVAVSGPLLALPAPRPAMASAGGAA